MDRLIRFAGVVFLAFCIVFPLLFITGCGKGEGDVNATASGTPTMPVMPGASMPGTGMPGSSGMSRPGMPGQPMVGPGMPGSPGMPGAPGTPPTNAPVSNAPKKPVVEFSQVQLASPVKHISMKHDNATVEYLRFQYKDWEGKTQVCEMPAGEAKVARTEGAWIATFDIYKKEAVQKTEKKEPIKRLNDFPFISPPPQTQPNQQQQTPSYPGSYPTYPTGPAASGR